MPLTNARLIDQVLPTPRAPEASRHEPRRLSCHDTFPTETGHRFVSLCSQRVFYDWSIVPHAKEPRSDHFFFFENEPRLHSIFWQN